MKYLVVAILFYSQFSIAESMDMETHNMLIEKMEIGKSVSKNAQVDLRLADLYSDRSRLRLIEEEEKNCRNCKKSKADRKKSLTIYHRIFNRLDREQQERVFLQVSESHNLLGETSKAIAFHKKVMNGKRYHKNLRALAILKQAEHEFISRNYSKAYKYFKTAIKMDKKLNTPLTGYRMAWCEFNSGQFMVAKNHLAEILQSNQKLDGQLREDVAKDHAKFTAKGPIDQDQLRQVHKLSTQASAMSNLEVLASELDRLGRPNESLDASLYILENFEMSDPEKALAYLRMAQAQQSLQRNKQTIENFKKSISYYQKSDCEEAKFQCNEYTNKSRKFIVFWNKIDDDRPSQSLLVAWVVYLEGFPKSWDMNYMAAQSFYKAKSHEHAVKYYLATSRVLKEQEKVKKEKKLFMAALESAMTVAEESGKLPLKRQAYTQYLVIYPEGNKSTHAHYQLAYLK